jgi:hypothetical protein
LLSYNLPMDPNLVERLQLDRHRAVIEAAELRARLLPSPTPSPAGRWVARHLRTLADRLDRGAGLEATRPAGAMSAHPNR